MSVAAAGDPAGQVPELYDDPFRLTAEQVAKLRAYGRESEVVAGAVVFAAGSDSWGMAVVVEGGLEIVDRQGLHGERVVVRYGPNQFTGELGLRKLLGEGSMAVRLAFERLFAAGRS